MSDTELSVLHRRQGRIGRITLNRPRALNALDPSMIAQLRAVLAEWQHDPAVHAVVIEGAGGKAFCAGGDVRAMRDAVLTGHHDVVEQFFAEEYALNLAIARYPKPYIAIVDGICMGGGIGLSIHGTIRIVAGHIAAIDQGSAIPAGAIDCEGDLVLPGLIELHTDNLERHIEPRPRVKWPHASAIIAHDAELASVGITTVFDALRVGSVVSNKKANYGEYARQLAD